MNKIILISFVVIISQICAAENVAQRLVQDRRSFLKFVDEDQLASYLSSFGASPTRANARSHEIFKRESKTMRKSKRTKKVSTTTTTEIPAKEVSESVIPMKPLSNEKKNFNVSPRHIVKFELDDAKYSEEYEKFRQSKKLRVKRSSDFGSNSNSTTFITKETFIQPRELFRFSYLDAVTKPALSDVSEMRESRESGEKKNKRETSDSSAADTKKIHMSNPMRGYRSTKHVSYDDIPAKLQKMIDNALNDAVTKGKASEGDYLKFFYGDKIIKVPVSMTKYVTKSKETPTTYVKKFPQEEKKSEPLQLLTTKNAYYPRINPSVQVENKPKYLQAATEKPTEYASFVTPINVPQEIKSSEISYLPYKKSVYYFTNNEDASQYTKNSMSSPGPVLFEDSIQTTPSSIEAPKSHHYKNYIYHPPTKVSIVKDEIPIIEHVNENYEFIPSPQKNYAPIPPATSYIEYAGNHADSHDHSKNYEFGYHISDYKTGNNFGHSQQRNKEGTKGEYSILLPDGRVQIVKYVADDSGFHADVSYQNVH